MNSQSIPPETLTDLLLAARRWAGRDFLVAADRSVGFDDFLERVDSVAEWLRAAGVRPGDRVGVFLPKSFEEAVATFAIARLGAVLVNLTSKTLVRRVAEILQDCEFRCLFTTPRAARELQSAATETGCRLVAVGAMPDASDGLTPWSAIPSAEFQAPAAMAPTAGDLAAILYTSGSSGRSKGVMISHRNLMHATHRVARYLRNCPTDRILAVLPLSAPWGVLQLSTALLSGATVILQPALFPVEIIRTVRSQAVTGLAAMPPTWIQLVELLEAAGEALDSLRYVTTSGGVIPQRILAAFPHVFPNAEVFLTYGLTEAFRTTLVPPDWFRRKPGSLGRACPGVDIFVVKPGEGLCGPGERGELIHRGPAVTLGYWKDPEATALSFRPCAELRHLIGDEIVHHSGDLVEADADGFLWFIGRKDALIKVAGHRVSAEEIELAAVQTGLVSQAVAFGVRDEAFGQVIHLAVEPVAHARVEPETLLSHCRRTLPSHMVPRYLTVWPEPMPRTGTGKIDRDLVIRHLLPDQPVSASGH